MDALSLTRERVGVWVSEALPDTRTHWCSRRIWIRGDFGRPGCTLSPALSRKLNGRGSKRGHALNRARSWRLSTDPKGEIREGEQAAETFSAARQGNIRMQSLRGGQTQRRAYRNVEFRRCKGLLNHGFAPHPVIVVLDIGKPSDKKNF